MTLGDLNNQLTAALKNYIKTSGHNETGRLYGSIQFACTNNKGLRIQFNTMDYIQYLDHGDFLDKFFQLDNTIDIIEEFIVSDMESRLD